MCAFSTIILPQTLVNARRCSEKWKSSGPLFPRAARWLKVWNKTVQWALKTTQLLILLFLNFSPQIHFKVFCLWKYQVIHRILLLYIFRMFLLYSLTFEKSFASWLQDYQQWQHAGLSNTLLPTSSQKCSDGIYLHSQQPLRDDVTHCADTHTCMGAHTHTRWEESSTQRWPIRKRFQFEC